MLNHIKRENHAKPTKPAKSVRTTQMLKFNFKKLQKMVKLQNC